MFSPQQRRTDAISIFQAALDAAAPHRCIERCLRLSDDCLHIGASAYPLTEISRLVVVGAGKATPAMAAAVETLLGPHISCGAINTKYGHSLALEKIRTTECGHPLPDDPGIAGTTRMLQLISDLDAKALVLCLFSGGGSALMPAPAAGLSLAEKQQTTQLLLACGATIDEINTVRKHLSQVKGGQLARLAQPARVESLLISDVIGDRLDTIASGPTYPDPTTFADSLALIEYYGLKERLPAAVRHHLEMGLAGEIAETPKEGDPCFSQVNTRVIGNNSDAIAAAEQAARQLGYTPLVLSSRIGGETREVAGVLAAIAQEVSQSGRPLAAPACLISGGETTVTLSGTGKGGRNQEFALAAAPYLEGWEQITVLSGGTDGTDGPTDAAGAIVDSQTTARASKLGLDTAAHLAANNSYAYFDALGDLLITGPTLTNVMDLRLFLIA